MNFGKKKKKGLKFSGGVATIEVIKWFCARWN
jgi:hypothetical protein